MTLTPHFAAAEELTLERIFDSPSLSGPALREARLSSAGDRVSFLRGRDDDANTLDLWQYRVDTGQTGVLLSADALMSDPIELSDEEKARRERARIADLGGIVEYRWAGDGRHLLLPLGGDVWLVQLQAAGETAAADVGADPDVDLPPPTDADEAAEHLEETRDETLSVRQLTSGEAFDLDPKISPDGAHVAFIRDRNLWLVPAEGGEARALTTSGSDTISSGTAEFIAQEEMGRDTGYWWSPDSRRIAFLEVDEDPIAPSLRYEVRGNAIEMIEQRYPYAGTPNVTYRLGVVEIDSGETRWIPLGEEPDIYIPRVAWAPDSNTVVFQRQSRDQQTLELIAYDLTESRQRALLTETSETWINLHDDLHFLEQMDAFIWSSERSGYRHLYLIGLDGEILRPLTAGDWPVAALAGVDEDLGLVYFTAGVETPTERQLYRQSLVTATPEAVQKVSRRTGWHQVSFDGAGRNYLDLYSSTEQPPQLSLHSADGERIAWLVENRVDQDHPYAPFRPGHRPTEFGTITAADGQPLHYRLVPPADFDASRRYPVFVHVYGGPTSRMVLNQWGRRHLIDQYMARQGYLVFSIDNRGIEGQGVTFQAPAYLNLGRVEVKDQITGIEYLKTLDFVDPERIGVFGWSYGGYMSLMLPMQHPGVFAAAVAVAPVTDWALYDTHYTERYLGMPRDETGEPTEAYRLGDVLSYAERLADPLLLIHGMADDNVLFTHSTMLMQALQQASIDFELMTYPGEKHAIAGDGQRLHVYRQIDRFLRRQLLD
ncbi:MAG: S9 family peptidase [Gammaproteobacteria bacterium HGW-Gammaproteobacteria-8]|nr:MAG: S9 family peptidase [Gammaproteobacteria bacterium HGW-Gammaproteobacteria-8]